MTLKHSRFVRKTLKRDTEPSGSRRPSGAIREKLHRIVWAGHPPPSPVAYQPPEGTVHPRTLPWVAAEGRAMRRSGRSPTSLRNSPLDEWSLDRKWMTVLSPNPFSGILPGGRGDNARRLERGGAPAGKIGSFARSIACMRSGARLALFGGLPRARWSTALSYPSPNRSTMR